MGVTPIDGIHQICALKQEGAEDEVRPPFALNHSGRMGDDAYAGSEEEAERGLEEEEPEVEETSEDSPSVVWSVNFFA